MNELKAKLQSLRAVAEAATPGPWLRGVWNILPEDRDHRGYGTAWTFQENDHGDDYAQGPFGRKAKEPERLIEGYGYECDGVGFRSEADERFFLTARNEFLPLLDALSEAVEALEEVTAFSCDCRRDSDGAILINCPQCIACTTLSSVETLLGEKK